MLATVKNIPRRMIPPYAVDRPREYFAYNAVFFDLAGTTTQSTRVEIDGDSDFELIKICTLGFLAEDGGMPTGPTPGDVTFVPVMPLQIVDLNTARPLFDTDMDMMNIWSQGQVPFVLPQPHPINSGTTLEFTITNPYTAPTYDYAMFVITMHGSKVFK